MHSTDPARRRVLWGYSEIVIKKQHYINNACRGTEADIARAVAAARAAVGESFGGPWGRMSAALRGRLMLKLSAAVTARHEEFAQVEARDAGKSLKTARVDTAALARDFEYYGGACDKLHGETLPYDTGYTVLTIWTRPFRRS